MATADEIQAHINSRQTAWLAERKAIDALEALIARVEQLSAAIAYLDGGGDAQARIGSFKLDLPGAAKDSLRSQLVQRRNALLASVTIPG